MTIDEMFVELLERPESLMTETDWKEIERLSRQLDERDRYLDAGIRGGFRELDEALVRVH
jgi:hypothetical protein